jgi:hypothetical protein
LLIAQRLPFKLAKEDMVASPFFEKSTSLQDLLMGAMVEQEETSGYKRFEMKHLFIN